MKSSFVQVLRQIKMILPDLPPTIADETALDELLSEPSSTSIQSLAEIPGDVIVLGAGGKMGPTLARMIRRAAEITGTDRRVIAVSRFSNPKTRTILDQQGVDTIACDLLDPGAIAALPDAANVFSMAAAKFGTSNNPSFTWAINVHLPALICQRYASSRIVAFSSGNIYPLVTATSGGSVETDEVDPHGEYAITALGRERIYEYFSRSWHIPVVLLRLNYAVEMRYGVLLDLALQVYHGHTIDLTMGFVNVIWQADANAMAIAALTDTASPHRVINVAGPEILRIRDICEHLANEFGREVCFTGTEAETAWLNNGSDGHAAYGLPRISPDQIVRWIADWVKRKQPTLSKPTHFQVRDGKF